MHILIIGAGLAGLTCARMLDRWKIDVPDTLTADKLKQNVLDHLTAADEMRDQWPADVNEAYAVVTHHVLMALMDQPAQQK